MKYMLSLESVSMDHYNAAGLIPISCEYFDVLCKANAHRINVYDACGDNKAFTVIEILPESCDE